VISLVGTPAPERSAIALALADATGVTDVSLDELGGGEPVELDVSGWSAEAVAEALAPLVDGRVQPSDAAVYLADLTRVHRLATHFDEAAPDWPDDVAQLRDALADQVKRDLENRWLWDAWGSAVTHEDDADRPTVADEVLRWLDEIESGGVGGSPAPPAGVHHAGALHTYGYLCSSLWTKHGWKRTRWIGGGIAAAAGIPPDLLRPIPPSGTLLSNATALVARLLGWELPDGGRPVPAVEPTAKLLGRVIEVATAVKSSDGEVPLAEPIEIRTSLFRSDHQATTRAPNLLVYTVIREGVERVLTLFDVDDTKVESLLHPHSAELGEGTEVRLRYNAWLGGIGSAFVGHRSVTNI